VGAQDGDDYILDDHIREQVLLARESQREKERREKEKARIAEVQAKERAARELARKMDLTSGGPGLWVLENSTKRGDDNRNLISGKVGSESVWNIYLSVPADCHQERAALAMVFDELAQEALVSGIHLNVVDVRAESGGVGAASSPAGRPDSPPFALEGDELFTGAPGGDDGDEGGRRPIVPNVGFCLRQMAMCSPYFVAVVPETYGRHLDPALPDVTDERFLAGFYEAVRDGHSWLLEDDRVHRSAEHLEIEFSLSQIGSARALYFVRGEEDIENPEEVVRERMLARERERAEIRDREEDDDDAEGADDGDGDGAAAAAAAAEGGGGLDRDAAAGDELDEEDARDLARLEHLRTMRMAPPLPDGEQLPEAGEFGRVQAALLRRHLFDTEGLHVTPYTKVEEFASRLREQVFSIMRTDLSVVIQRQKDADLAAQLLKSRSALTAAVAAAAAAAAGTSVTDLSSVESAAITQQTLSPIPVADLLAKARSITPHVSFMTLARQLYLFRMDNFNRIDNLFSEDNVEAICVTGAPGVGKSSLLANWVHYRMLASNSVDWVLPYFVGALGASRSLRRMLAHLISEIQQRFRIPEPVPRSDAKLVQDFSFWCHIAAFRTQGNFYLVLDGVDGLIYDCCESLDDWLPPTVFRKRVLDTTELIKVSSKKTTGQSARAALEAGEEAVNAVAREKRPAALLSVSSGSIEFKRVVSKRRWPVVTVEPLSLVARKVFLERLISTAGTVYITDREVNLLLENVAASTPAMLRWVVEDLWHIKVAKSTVTWSIDRYLSAQTPAELMMLRLARAEESELLYWGLPVVPEHHSLPAFTVATTRLRADVERADREAELRSQRALQPLTRLLCCLSMSLRGLVLSEASGVTGLPEGEVRLLVHRIGTIVVQNGLMLNLTSSLASDAVRLRYLASPAQERAHRSRLIRFFSGLPKTSVRRAIELPYHYFIMGDQEALLGFLRDPIVLRVLWSYEDLRWTLDDYLTSIGDPTGKRRRMARQEPPTAATAVPAANSSTTLLAATTNNSSSGGGGGGAARQTARAPMLGAPSQPSPRRNLNHGHGQQQQQQQQQQPEPSPRQNQHPPAPASVSILSILMEACTTADAGNAEPERTNQLRSIAEILIHNGLLREALPVVSLTARRSVEYYGPLHPFSGKDIRALLSLASQLGEHDQVRPHVALVRENAGRAAVLRLLNDDNAMEIAREKAIAEMEMLRIEALTCGDDYDAAWKLLRTALDVMDTATGEQKDNQPEMVALLQQSYQVLEALGEHLAAAGMLRRIHTLTSVSYGPAHPKVAVICYQLAQHLARISLFEEAYPWACQAQEINRIAYGQDSEHTIPSKVLVINIAAGMHAQINVQKKSTSLPRYVYDSRRFVDMAMPAIHGKLGQAGNRSGILTDFASHKGLSRLSGGSGGGSGSGGGGGSSTGNLKAAHSSNNMIMGSFSRELSPSLSDREPLVPEHAIVTTTVYASPGSLSTKTRRMRTMRIKSDGRLSDSGSLERGGSMASLASDYGPTNNQKQPVSPRNNVTTGHDRLLFSAARARARARIKHSGRMERHTQSVVVLAPYRALPAVVPPAAPSPARARGRVRGLGSTHTSVVGGPASPSVGKRDAEAEAAAMLKILTAPETPPPGPIQPLPPPLPPLPSRGGGGGGGGTTPSSAVKREVLSHYTVEEELLLQTDRQARASAGGDKGQGSPTKKLRDSSSSSPAKKGGAKPSFKSRPAGLRASDERASGRRRSSSGGSNSSASKTEAVGRRAPPAVKNQELQRYQRQTGHVKVSRLPDATIIEVETAVEEPLAEEAPTTSYEPYVEPPPPRRPESSDVLSSVAARNEALRDRLAAAMEASRSFAQVSIEADFVGGAHPGYFSWRSTGAEDPSRVLQHSGLRVLLDPNDAPEVVDVRDNGDNAQLQLELPPSDWASVTWRVVVFAMGVAPRVIFTGSYPRSAVVSAAAAADVDGWGTGAKVTLHAQQGFGSISFFFYPSFKGNSDAKPVDIVKDVQFTAAVENFASFSNTEFDPHGWNRLILK
jgi:hypothetical protein